MESKLTLGNTAAYYLGLISITQCVETGADHFIRSRSDLKVRPS